MFQPVGLCFDRDIFQECQAFINRVREATHVSLMEFQKAKYNMLWHKIQVANQTSTKTMAVMVIAAVLAKTCIQIMVAAQTLTLPAHLQAATAPQQQPLHPSSDPISSVSDITARWVKNVSSTPLTEA